MPVDLTIDRLLLAGVAAALLFFAVPTVAIFRRPGFDIERHAISMLSLGEGGWVMKAVFLVSGLLTFLCALGLYRVLAQGWPGFTAAILIGLFGVGLVLAGLFDAPAGLGFPPAAGDDPRRRRSQHGIHDRVRRSDRIVFRLRAALLPGGAVAAGLDQRRRRHRPAGTDRPKHLAHDIAGHRLLLGVDAGLGVARRDRAYAHSGRLSRQGPNGLAAQAAQA
ncbi:DUF998 domain-containing protein [Hyphomicrobium facile]|uniref:DUF998 domain-containing protein n=1 Tax=Hyphomicrobium facile TaxID=51670 RepID=A0A1I7NJN4_9HYPH|nr:DUF998 domain-containing protein [Hyphomicrobium facile]SFV34847.1 Protein of unknown function [Hyphomicrobium facile]